MPPELLPIDRKDFLKDRKPSSSEPVETVPARWRESPTTPSSHPNNHGPLSCRWGGAGGPSDFRRPFTGSRVSVDFGSQKDQKGGTSWETTASPNGNSHPQSDFVNSWDQLQSNDQHTKNNGGGVRITGGHTLDKSNSLGSSLDWKPLKWIRSGSLSSRGSGFSHSSSCKIIGVDSLDTKIEAPQLGNNNLVQSPSGDAAPCVTPRTPDEANSRKKARLGWGEGLAKYEKKKVDPDDIVDKEGGPKYVMVDGVSSSEPSLPSPSNLPVKSPSVAGYSECASPTTSCSFACSSSPGLEEKTSITAAAVDNDTCNPSHVSQNHTNGLTFNLENLELTEGFSMSSLLDELLQTDDASPPGSGFAMEKLQVWKADITRTLEITETDIDSLENELKSLVSDRGSCPVPPASSSFLKKCNNKNTKDLRIIPSEMEQPDGFLEEHTAVKDLNKESPGTATSKFMETDSDAIEERESQDHVGDDSIVPTVSDGRVVCFDREKKLYDSLMASNKSIAKSTSDEISKLLPTTLVCTKISRVTDESLVEERIAKRKHFLKFKERVTTLKFRALHYNWKKDLQLLSIRKNGGKPQKKFEVSSRMGYADHQKHRASIHTRSCSPAGGLSLVPTREIVEYAKKLLSDSRVKDCRNVQKMPTFILDKSVRVTSRFISDNGLVENPIDVEKEKSIVKPWTVEDRETFLEKYTLYGKNFRKIASFFPNKTVADCVEFYYKNHKSDYFQKTKKKPEFLKGKSSTANTYLLTSGKQRLNRDTRATTSLDMLGAASAMVANVNSGSRIISQQSTDFAMFCNEQETAAADVLAGICGSISPEEALGSCVTSLVENGDVHHRVRRCQKLGGSSLNDVINEETCSDDSCGEEMNSSHWTDEEKASFIKAVRTYGKDFSMISRCVRTRSSDQCKIYFSKARGILGLDVIDVEGGSEGTTGANQGGGGGSDHDDTCMVDSGSGISNDNPSMVDLHSSDCREPELLVLENSVTCDAENKPAERSSNSNLEGAADSETAEAANMEESPQNTCSDSASGAKVEETKVSIEGIREESEHELPGSAVEDLNSSVTYYSRVASLDLRTDHGNNLDLNAASENVSCQEMGGNNGFVMSNLFPKKDVERKTVSQDDVSSRLSFRKSGQRSSSIDGYHNLHFPTRSLSYDPQNSFKLDESLLLPRDGCIQMSTDLMTPVPTYEQRRSSSVDMEKPKTSRSGDVKLFGQILTNNSSSKLPKANEKPDAGKSLKFNNFKNKDYAFGVESDLQLSRSYGFWDGNRIQTGFSSLPDSAVLLAKYPAAFSNVSSLESGKEQCNINNAVVSGFQSRKPSNTNRGPSYHGAYVGQPFTVDKLLPEVQVSMNGVGGVVACNGVSDPVAAIRVHYAKTEHYKNGESNWRSNVSDIGSR